MSEMMGFPADWQEFVQQYQFADREETYTNGAMLIPSLRVRQMVEHYFGDSVFGRNPDGLPNGLTISDDGKLLDWRGENYVRQSALGGGKLTAEQVREAAKSNSRKYESPVDDGVWIREYDWQAIADELNATLGDSDAVAFCKRVESAAKDRKPLTLFGVDYDAACVDKGIPQGADGNLDQAQADWLRLMPDGWDGTPPTLGNGECEVVSTEDTCDFVHKRHTLSCGHVVGAYSEPPNFCPKCGCKVRKAVK